MIRKADTGNRNPKRAASSERRRDDPAGGRALLADAVSCSLTYWLLFTI